MGNKDLDARTRMRFRVGVSVRTSGLNCRMSQLPRAGADKPYPQVYAHEDFHTFRIQRVFAVSRFLYRQSVGRESTLRFLTGMALVIQSDGPN